MNQITKPNANTARYAVIRCFQPARVEGELLAQVFELVGRGSDEHFDPSDDGQERPIMAVKDRSKGHRDLSVFSLNDQSQFKELEDVA